MDTLKLNKSDYKIVGGYLLLATFFLLIKFRIENYTLIEYLIDIPVSWIQTLALLIISKTLIEHFFLKKRNYLLLIILAVFSLWFVSFLSMLSGEFTRDGFINWGKLPPIGELFILNINSSIFNLCIPLSLLAGKKYYEYQLNHVKLADAKKEIELRMLRSQFDPHFLYNNLNTLDALIDYSPKEKVKEYISHLAALYRHLVKIKDEEIVEVEAELDLARNYLFLIKTRFEDDYIVSFHLEVKSENKYLPSGALLSLLENIIKHNKAMEDQPVKITISMLEDMMCVQNTKTGAQEISKTSLGTGLSNLEKRYALLSEKQMEIVETKQDFSVYLPLLQVIN